MTDEEHTAEAVADISDPQLAEIVRRLVAAFHPQRIYLFGSKARNEGGDHSDYDLMMLLDELAEPSYRLAQQAHSCLWDVGAAADVLVWPRETFDSRVHVKASLPATITREGKLLYVA